MSFLLLLLITLGSLADTCARCGSTGRLPCKEHPAAECSLEDAVLYCSVVEGCATCGGAGFVSCTACKDVSARQTLEERRRRIQERKAALATIDTTMGRPLRKAESAHFVFVWEKDEHKIDKRLVPPHEALHVYIARMEKMFADYCAVLSVDEKRLREKCWLFVWYFPEDHDTAAVKLCEASPEAGGVKLLGIRPRYSVLGNPKEFRTDDQLHRNLLHHTAHLLLSHQDPTAWIGNMKGGWADEGLAHWFECRTFGISDNYCFGEADTNKTFEKGQFRLGVRKLVAKEDEPPMAEVLQLNIDALTLEMHALAFSYVDYLISIDGAKLDAVVKQLKSKVPSRDAIQTNYGMNLLELEEKWKEWVLDTYPTR